MGRISELLHKVSAKIKTLDLVVQDNELILRRNKEKELKRHLLVFETRQEEIHDLKYEVQELMITAGMDTDVIEQWSNLLEETMGKFDESMRVIQGAIKRLESEKGAENRREEKEKFARRLEEETKIGEVRQKFQMSYRTREEQIHEEQKLRLAKLVVSTAEQRNLLSPGVRSRANSFYSDGGLLSPGGGARESGVGLRESGDVEGVRLQNNLYVSGDISEADAEQWRNRRLIPNNTLYNEVEEELKRLQTGLEELQKYLKEKKNTTIVLENELSMSETTKRFLRSNSVRSRGRGRGRGRMHKVRQPVTYVRDSAMQSPQQTIRTSSGREVVVIDDPSTVTMSESEPEDWQGESSDSSDSSDFEWSHPSAAKKEKERRRQKRKHRSSDDGEEETEDEEVDVTGSDSEKKSNRRRGRRRRNRRESDQSSKDSEKSDSSSEGSNESSSNEESEVEKKPTIIEISSTIQSNCNESSPKMKLRNSPRKTRRRRKRKRIAMPTKKEKPREIKERKPFKKKEKKEIKSRNPPPPIENLEEYLHYYQPPEWLLRSDTRKFPYVPQIGDEVYYLRQGHHLYVQEVITQNEYDIQEGRQAYRRYDLDPAELCKLVGLAYDVGPPKMCSLKLELISKKKSTGAKKTITIRFHDMPNVVDFLVLKHIYDKSLEQNWKEGDRFRCIIDELWYYGTIQAVSPFNDEFPTSSFLCLGVKWDSGEEERLSPWDLEKVPGDQDEAVVVGTSVQEEEVDLYKYQPTEQDWPFESLDEMTERIAQGLEEFSSLDFVAPFAFPVDVKLYPSYWSCIAFPTDLETIRTKINKRFYRRIDALLWEIRQLRTNASKFNEQGSGIVLDAAYIVKLLTKFIRDPAQRNILDLNDELTEIEASKITYDEHDSEEEEEMEEFEQLQDAAEVAGGSSSGSSSNSAKTWVVEAKSLLEFICSKDDAHPFREPVDPDMFEGYSDVIREPMDLSTIRHRLESNQYDNAEAYIRDFQLMFKNSKTYNTDRRSLIYKMTLRLSALFETRCDVVRRAYAMDNDMNPHWTRGKSKQLVRIQLHGIYGDSSKNPISINSNFPKIKKEETVSNSPRKPKFITLNQFVKRPQTRSSRNEVENRSSSPEVLIKKSKYEMNGYSNSEDEDEETKPGLNDIKRTRPNRKTVKRKMYGFEESDDENVAETKRSKRKLLPRVKISRLKSKTESVGHTTRSSRNKTTVNYCDDYYDEFSEDEVDNENLIEVKRERDSTDNSNASEESENEKPIVTISSRGRMRKASRKFPFF